MKAVFIVGSPRKNGNTATIVEKIVVRIKDDIDCEILYLSDYELNGCLGCSHCQGVLEDIGCVQKDDTEKLLRKLISSDILIYGTPLYGHSYSGQLKLFMDRHVALMKFVAGGDKAVDEMEICSYIKGKPCGLIVSCQGPEKDNTELIKAQFYKFCQSSLSNCFGKYIFPWCDPQKTNSTYSAETFQKIIDDILDI